MRYESIKEWVQEVQKVFQVRFHCSERFANNEAETLASKLYYSQPKRDLDSLPDPKQCVDDLVEKWAQE